MNDLRWDAEILCLFPQIRRNSELEESFLVKRKGETEKENKKASRDKK